MHTLPYPILAKPDRPSKNLGRPVTAIRPHKFRWRRRPASGHRFIQSVGRRGEPGARPDMTIGRFEDQRGRRSHCCLANMCPGTNSFTPGGPGDSGIGLPAGPQSAGNQARADLLSTFRQLDCCESVEQGLTAAQTAHILDEQIRHPRRELTGAVGP